MLCSAQAATHPPVPPISHAASYKLLLADLLLASALLALPAMCSASSRGGHGARPSGGQQKAGQKHDLLRQATSNVKKLKVWGAVGWLSSLSGGTVVEFGGAQVVARCQEEPCRPPWQHLAVPCVPAAAALRVFCSSRVGGGQTQTRRPEMWSPPSCSGGRRRRRCGGMAPSGRRSRTPQVPACLPAFLPLLGGSCCC